MGRELSSVGSRSNGSSAPPASSSSNRSAASTASLRKASSSRSVVLSSVVTHPGFARCGYLLALLDRQPLAAVGAHVLDQGDEGPALVRERVRDPGRNLGIGLALHDSLLFQRPEAQREGARADPVERALQL